MNRDEIITALFIGANFNRALSKMDPDYLREDLKMEVFAIVCEWADEKILALAELKQLEFYVVRVMLNQIQSSTSPFFKKYRKVFYQIGLSDISNAESQTDAGLNQLNQFHRTDKAGLFSPDFLIEREVMDRRIGREDFEENLIEKINTLPWYDAEMVKLYLECGSFKKMETITMIPKPSCYKTVRNALLKLKHNDANPRAEAPSAKEIQAGIY